MSDGDVVVLDAAVVIALLDRSDAHHEAAATLLDDQADATFVMNPVNHGEALVGPARRRRLDEALALLGQIEVVTAEVPRDAGRELASIRAATGAKMPDCCALLTARQHRARLATFDERLRSAAASLGIEVIS